MTGRLHPGPIMGVGLAIHLALGWAVVRRGSLPGDAATSRAFADIERRLGGGSTVARVSDMGGEMRFVAMLVGCTAVDAAARRRVDQAAALVVGFSTLALTIPRAKRFWNRDRPPDMLAVQADGSYPSAHCAYATSWVVCACVSGRSEWAPAGLVVATGVALTRMYLRVHFLSDVAGGAALGFAAYGLAMGRPVVHPRSRPSYLVPARARATAS